MEGVGAYLERLEEQKMLMMYQLKLIVESMAGVIREFEGELEREYGRVKEEVLEEVKIREKMGELVE